MNQKKRFPGTLLAGLLLALVCAVLGFAVGRALPAAAPTVEEEGPALNLTVTEDDTADSRDLLVQDEFTKVSLRSGLSQADILVDGQSMHLEDALSQGLVTQAQLAFFARQDAENGYCQLTHETRNGLTHLTYQYPTFNLRVIYDVYVTPDGGQDLIRHITVYPARENERFGAYVNFYDPETGERTDLEDWGLTITLEQTSATGAQIAIAQSGGQQIGQLSVDWYDLSNQEGFYPRLDGSAESPAYDTPLDMGGQTTLTLDWTDIYGQLPAGTYTLGLNIRDHFQQSDVHPLMQDYHDWQVYTLEISVP